MSDAFAAAGLIWFVIFAYALAGSVDLGATFWRMVFVHGGDREAERIAERYVSALWEAANVFLVLIAVGMVGFFPGASYAYGTVLLLPASAILVLLALRGSFLAFAHAAPHPPRWFWDVAGLTGVLLPALLVSVLPVSEGGFVRQAAGRLSLDLGALLGSPAVYAYAAFGMAASLFISATFLADYARTAGSWAAYRSFRRHAVWTGPVMIAVGVTALFVLPRPAWLVARLYREWPWFAASLVAFALALVALWWPANRGACEGPTTRHAGPSPAAVPSDAGRTRAGGPAPATPTVATPSVQAAAPASDPGVGVGAAAAAAAVPDATPGRPRLAVVLVGIQLALADVGYGIAHSPYLLYPQVRTAAGFSNAAMFSALVWVVVVGLCVLVPGFVWLWRLFVLDPRYTRS